MAKVSLVFKIKPRWYLPEMMIVAELALSLGADAEKIAGWLATHGYKIEVLNGCNQLQKQEPGADETGSWPA